MNRVGLEMGRVALVAVFSAIVLSACAGTQVDVHFWDPDAPVLPLLNEPSAEAPSTEAAPKLQQYVILLPDEDGTVGAIDVSDDETTARLTRAYDAVRFDNLAEIYSAEPPKEEAGGFSAALIHEPRLPATFTVYFELDSAEMTSESLLRMQEILTEITSRPAPQVWLIGHADRAGSSERNLRLSSARAEAVRAVLVQAGVPTAAIDTTWRGEDRPAVPTTDGIREPRNRRVLISIR